MPRHGWLVSWAHNGKSLPLAFFPHYDGTTSEATNWAACARFLADYTHPFYATAIYVQECN
jgi:hypothetical protein